MTIRFNELAMRHALREKRLGQEDLRVPDQVTDNRIMVCRSFIHLMLALVAAGCGRRSWNAGCQVSGSRLGRWAGVWLFGALVVGARRDAETTCQALAIQQARGHRPALPQNFQAVDFAILG